jgi:PAP2 superfamily protein
MTKALRCGVGTLVLVLAAAGALADEVTDWNRMMLRVGLVANTSPLNMTRTAALVQAAVFDAINGIDGRYSPVRVAPAAPPGASRRAAIAQAAYVILSKLYGAGGTFTPNQQATLDARRTAALVDIGYHDSQAAITAGVAWGQTVADQIWAWRLTDGFNTNPPTFTGSATVGQWRPTPNDPYPGTSTNGVGFPQFSSQTPWAIQSQSQFRPGGPHALGTPEYAADFNETKSKGSQSSTTRTPDETQYSWFWNTGTGTYIWNNVALDFLARRDDDAHDDAPGFFDRAPWGHRRDGLLENARVLAMLDLSMADAGIGCWDAKYTYTAWRPITAIREAATDGNDATTADATWKPLFATPGHPEYPSGHSCLSGAAARVLIYEFRDRVRFEITTDLMLGVTRSYRSVSQALDEVINARVFAGIHFRKACEDGTELGKAVADYVIANKFQRVK